MQFSRQGLRVLALAYKECSDSEVLTAASEYGYTFIGLVSMIDPPREESMAAVADAISVRSQMESLPDVASDHAELLLLHRHQIVSFSLPIKNVPIRKF